ncbi:MAG: NAD-glutamate dehydrogenase domain-containing protein, partial [Candidatus Binataceae bacterium]
RLEPEERLQIAESAFEFFYRRTTEIKLRVASGLDGDGVTIVQSAMPDCPFIIDSVLEYFRQIGAPIRMLLHPVFTVARDESGRLSSFEQGRDDERRESLFHAEIEQAATPEERDGIARELERALEEVRLATGDFERMTARALAIREETSTNRELTEMRDFLRWLVYGGFVFLGYRRYRVPHSNGEAVIQADTASALGIMRAAANHTRFLTPWPVKLLDESQQRLMFEGSPLIISKTRNQSRVHRRRAMDDITIRRVGPDGEIAFDRFLGLFTSKAYSEEAQHIPVLRAKLGKLLEAARATPGSHDFKEIVSAFNSFPKEELFRATVDELRNQLNLVLDLRSESAVRLSLNADPERGHVIALVLVPRERFSAEVRMRIQAALSESLGGPLVYYYLALGDSYTARLHFCFSAPAPKPALGPVLEREIARLARGWRDRLHDELIDRFGARRGAQLARRWSNAFSADYQAGAGIERAIADIETIERMLERGGGAEVSLAAGDQTGVAELRMYELDEAPLLSNLMPVLQNFGLQVISEAAHEFQPGLDTQRGRQPFAQVFRVAGIRRETFENGGAALIADALKAVISGLAEDDPLNGLTVSAGLSSREVTLLRAYMAAAFQMRLAPARPALYRVVLLHPELARMLVDLFAARLNPDRETDPAAIDKLHAIYLDQLGVVDNIAEDRIARTLLSLIDATVRTNYFCTPPAAYVALKFESGKIPSLGDVAPFYEIHVNSPRMEGCHLRAGRIARGGIRYSDRPDDYRTEILDLMKTQTVKNAIIVPIGSKGGFVVKARLSGAPTHQDVVEAYQALINAMLDLTDNLSDGRVVRPARVKVLDNDGAYLVVAADKGTAAFSDIANGIAQRRGFWLGDAFASGGEHGYDHKALGITARGAWESAKWHLREMGRDLKSGAPITMVGIGDMSGDVFGNGLLQSENVKLEAAFDHRHIFIDPNPDPAISFAERRRLFDLPNSKWSDYDPALISRGGGVFKRGQKRISLSPEARAALGCDEEALDSDSLIRAILRADVDMLYNGGIGTYVRATSETDMQAGDHANDNCRITAGELRARIVVEGGNLGLTQKARIEYALAGGRINTDAIDNSAGVDTSDHEVNLKILLQPAMVSGGLRLEDRNRRLAECADEVAERVLQDNRDQVLSLSLEQIRSRTTAEIYREHFVAIEQRGLLHHHEEAFPTAEELRQRRASFPGLTRPELAVVTAYTKIDLVARLE